MTPDGVYVEGLRDVRKGLAKVDKDLGKELRKELKGVAERGARDVKAAVPRGPASKTKAKTGRYAGKKMGPWHSKISAGATQQSAYVTWGRKTVPYAAWLEFGGAKRQPRGGLAVRARRKDGRYVYPTVDRLRPVLARDADAAVGRVIRKAGF